MYNSFYELLHSDERMSTEIPVWVNGKIRWLSGIDKKTTCKDVIEVMLKGEGIDKSEVKDFAIMERWRKVERPLDENSKILKIWSHWGNEKKEVRLCLRRIDNEVDSGRGSPITSGHTPSLRRKRNRARGNGKPPWNHPETLHPRRLAELGKFDKKEFEYSCIKLKQNEGNSDNDRASDCYILDNKQNYDEVNKKIYDNENLNNLKKSGHKSYHCSGTGRLHSTPLQSSENHSKRSKCCSKRESKQKLRNSENIEKLMKLILVQGATIQSQLKKLKEREEQIESLEHDRHRERIEKNGRNYLLETYLGSLHDAEIPIEAHNEKGNDNGIQHEEGSNQRAFSKRENSERTTSYETEPISVNSAEIYEEAQQRSKHQSEVDSSMNYYHLRPHQKSTRSKSESRTYDCKLEGSLKRTLSDNAIVESSGLIMSDNINNEKNKEQSDVAQDTKEQCEEVVELRRIQSQIEMWEKVFKINKKLEKEEENLVRLHIKIKKFLSENYKIAHDNSERNSRESEEAPEGAENHQTVEITSDQDCEKIQKELQSLRSDLDQNSKEIYHNFTKLIEEDNIVEQKRNCLSNLMSDLERTNYEHDMLNEMLKKSENQSFIYEHKTSYSENSKTKTNPCEQFPNSFYPSFVDNDEDLNFTISRKNMCSSTLEMPQAADRDIYQRTEVTMQTEKLQSSEPKIVKISFEDQTQDKECQKVKQCNETTPVQPGALKSILKNRKLANDKNIKDWNLDNDQTKLGQRCIYDDETSSRSSNISHDYVRIPCNFSSNYPEHVNLSYTYGVSSSVNNHISYEIGQGFYPQTSITELTNDIKTACSRNPQSSGILRTPTNVFSNSTMVTTKALVHNDTDSSTSSDTSGLSSMYSSSPTVEEHYSDQGYVLDTLV